MTFCYTSGTGMGLLGLLITIVIAALGAGYYYFGVPSSTITITNTNSKGDGVSSSIVSSITAAQVLKEQAINAKLLTEEKTKEMMAAVEEGTTGEASLATGMSADPEKALPESEKGTDTLEIIRRPMMSGYFVPDKPRTIDTIVLHSSYNPDGDAYSVNEIVKIYEGYKVGAHYLIDRGGKIYQLIDDANISYHAGVSKMPDGRKDVNDFSIGIEMMNKKDTEFTAAQYTSVNALIASLKKKYPIKSVVGHSDIAPDRKTDPWNFNWKKLQ